MEEAEVTYLSVDETEFGEIDTWGLLRVVGGTVGLKVVERVFGEMSEESADWVLSGRLVVVVGRLLLGGSLSSPFLMRSTMESTSVPESFSALPFTPWT